MSVPFSCEECKNSIIGGHNCWGSTNNNVTPCAKCNKFLCSECSGKYPLIPFENDLSKKEGKYVIKSYCKVCFQDTSVLDFTKTYDIIESESINKNCPIKSTIDTNNNNNNKNNNNNTNNNNNKTDNDDEVTIFVFVHGAGACRALFRPHAQHLAKLNGKQYRSILIDLPGHGTLSEKELTLDSCVETVKSVLEECNCIVPTEKRQEEENNGIKKTKQKIIYVGASLGAYVGFYILSKLQSIFTGAILLDCGQNVGPDASLIPRIGLWFLRKMTIYMSNKSLMNAMVNVTMKSKADYKLIETCFGAGMFFHQGHNHVDCMHSVNPAVHIPYYEFPILFCNGSKDHRDSELKWLQLCQNQKQSSLKTYDGGDHFFSHDSRFVNDLLQRIDTFASTI